ncbi:peptidase U32 family protein [Anoxynatronum buryatiense]|uniref:Protease n=1 Tax=Anoxynatronum buryatiense TaxID=489973 RepID=A0AA46AID6_9CLOT|nr:U32 family peptidase [Anoxynatronum buryatiense]SMP48944.1 putative protease [Anoxynatronum buryatiense]
MTHLLKPPPSIELLAPAGDLERLKTAVIYGADAVYLGGQVFGLRAAAKNFSVSQLEEGVAFAHGHGAKVYLTLNIIPHEDDLKELPEYLNTISHIPLDAFIVSDPGTFDMVQELAPQIPIHISTQANTTNSQSLKFWHRLGAQRVVLARELSLQEIAQIRKEVPATLELEAFIHGAMCISYSGRCLLSNYMIQRDANRGECAHPCRWKYHLVEEKRPGEYMPVYEDATGTYIFHSKDLCLIQHLPQLIKAGITSLKIEGRMKTVHYVATVVRAYRMALDAYLTDPDNWVPDPTWMQELSKASHRPFTTGFYFDAPGPEDHIYEDTDQSRSYDFIAKIIDFDPHTMTATAEQRNRFFEGDEVEIIAPHRVLQRFTITKLKNEAGESIEQAPHPQQIVTFQVPFEVVPEALIRKERRVKEAAK